MELCPIRVFIHSSIKTRIETGCSALLLSSALHVFIHSSIKTRIETIGTPNHIRNTVSFLYIVPLKQGLKLENESYENIIDKCFYT